MKKITFNHSKFNTIDILPSLRFINNERDWGLHFVFLKFHAWVSVMK
jgi:hypothetical protein